MIQVILDLSKACERGKYLFFNKHNWIAVNNTDCTSQEFANLQAAIEWLAA